MPTPTQAILLDVRAALADLNLQRSLSAFSLNYASQSGELRTLQVLLAGGAEREFICPDPCVLTVIRTVTPLNVEIVLRDNSTLDLNVKSLLVLDMDFKSFTLSNPAPSGPDSASKVSIIQG